MPHYFSNRQTSYVAFLWVFLLLMQGFAQPPVRHLDKPATLAIRNIMMVEGIGTPAEGPVDVLIANGRIATISSHDSTKEPDAANVLDGTGKYLLPGFINMHGHLQNSRAGISMPMQYQYNLWLASGITTMRDVGSEVELALGERAKSRSGEIDSPRIILYLWFPGGTTEAEIRATVRDLKKQGAEGIKCHQLDRATFSFVADEAKKQGLKIAHHIGIEDANVMDDIAAGTSTIEHWYGIPDAALTGVQQFPADFNHANELHRFRYAGRLWREADPKKLRKVLAAMVEAGVAWDPTFCIYEACRDLQRAVTQPWFDAYLHPALEAFFTPDPRYHGSFFWGWTHTDEVYWRENYLIWMKAVRDFEEMGGVVTTGEDAGFIYQMYGFGYLRELQLHQEAGFHPLEVIRHATWNGAQVLGKSDEIGRIKKGYMADLIVVNGNPLANLQTLMPGGVHPMLDAQRSRRGGGIEWTILAGKAYHAPTLLKEVREIVSLARKTEKE